MPDDVLNGILDSASNDQSATSTGRTPLVIDSDLRTIQVPTDYVFGVQNDKDVLSVPFVVPRYYDGVDLSELSIRVNFTTKSGLSSYYDVETITINSDTIEFSWLLGAAVFVSVGDLTFAVCIRNVEADGRITREFNTTLATAKILPGLEVENPEDPSQYSILVQMQNIAERAESYVGAPLTALTEDDMTDTTRIYVYVGEETGYTNGHWYYYSDDVWHDGGIYNAVAQMVDDTLTEEGVAADAKATGDAIAELDDSIQNGIHPDLYAGNLTTDKAQTDRTPYLQRATCNESGSGRIGQLCYETIVGASVGWNQLLDKDAFSTVGGTSSISGDVITVTPSGSNNRYQQRVDVIKNHVYYQTAILKSDGTNEVSFANYLYLNVYASTTSSAWTKIEDVRKASDSGTSYIQTYSRNSTEYQLKDGSFMLTDLTAEFGSSIADYIYSLESATAGSGIAKLREWGFLKGYQAHNAGSIESVEVTGKKVVGFNQFDLAEFARQYPTACQMNGDELTLTTDVILYRNGISVEIPSETVGAFITYEVKTVNATSVRVRIVYEDGTMEDCIAQTSSTYVTVTKALKKKRIVAVRFSWNASGTFNVRNLCINLSSSRNGEYEPYTEQTYDYGTDILNGIFKLDANNNLYADGDVKTSDGTITRKYNTLLINGDTDVLDGASGMPFRVPLSDASVPTSTSYMPNAIADKLQIITQSSTWGIPFTLSLATNHNIYFKLSDSITTIEDAKTYLASNPITLVYELATPTTEQSTPFTSPQVCYPYGTEEFITETPVPVGHETIYPYDLKAQAERLIDVPDVPSTNGTYVLKATRTSSGLTYSWVSG